MHTQKYFSEKKMEFLFYRNPIFFILFLRLKKIKAKKLWNKNAIKLVHGGKKGYVFTQN